MYSYSERVKAGDLSHLISQRVREVEFAPSARWHVDTIALHEFWIREAQRGTPLRSAFDPLDWSRLLPNIWMLDVAEPFRLRFRLVGTRIVEQLAFDPTGRWLDDAAPHLVSDAPFMERYRWSATFQRPLWTIGPADIRPDNPIAAVENLTLPFASNGGRADILMMLSIFHVV